MTESPTPTESPSPTPTDTASPDPSPSPTEPGPSCDPWSGLVAVPDGEGCAVQTQPVESWHAVYLLFAVVVVAMLVAGVVAQARR